MNDRSVEQAENDAPSLAGQEGNGSAHNASPWDTPRAAAGDQPDGPQGMIPARSRRRTKFERGSMRVLATGGIIGLATLLGALLASQDVAGWIAGLVVGLTSVILAAVLWSSRQL
jgi:hypothetical protein